MNTAIKTTLDFPGDSIPFKVPGTRYTVTLTWTEAGQTFTVTVDQGTYRLYELGSVHDLVNDPHAETKARHRARLLAAALRDGVSVEVLAQAVAMATNRQRVLDAPAAEIDAEFAAITQPTPQVGSATPRPYHPSTQRPVISRRAASRAHLADLSGPQLRALRSHRDGVVFPGDGTVRATLKALAEKGYGTVRHEGSRKRIVALELNGRGLAEVQVTR